MMTLDNEIKRNLVHEMIDVLEHYHYTPSYNACEKIIDTWFENKSTVMEPFTKLPGWNADKFMVVKDTDYERTVDIDTVFEFKYWAVAKANEMRVENKYFSGVYNNIEMHKIIDYLNREITLVQCKDVYMTSQGHTKANLKELNARLYKFSSELSSIGNAIYTTISLKRCECIVAFLNLICEYTSSEEFSPIITENMANKINDISNKYDVNVKAVSGQRIMKVIRKFLVWAEIDKESEYNSWIAKLGDAINPLKYSRFTILSFNPIDYLRMSMGTSWQSCHTIDKDNVDDRDGDHYDGMRANGTISYMLDKVSAVFYTLYDSYGGTDYELQSKVNRQMIHMGTPDNPVFISGRLYPQSNDGAEGNELRKQIRELMQYDISKAWGIDNFWSTKPATEGDKMYVTESGSAHYPDYRYSSCNCKTSIAKGHSVEPITIGYKGICIECGGNNYEEGELSCCNPFETRCYECGYDINRDDAHLIDGHWYCEDCCFYCEYHEEYELCRDDSAYVEDYGRVCQNALEYGDFFRCEYCDTWHTTEYEIYTEDEMSYCCTECAEDGGYIQLDNGDWVLYEDAINCPECGRMVHINEFNSEREMCNECAKEEVA